MVGRRGGGGQWDEIMGWIVFTGDEITLWCFLLMKLVKIALDGEEAGDMCCGGRRCRRCRKG